MSNFVRTDFSYPLGSTEANSYLHEVAVLDVNGDGKLDIVTANFLYPLENRRVPVHFLINDGAGHFTDGTSTLFPTNAPTASQPREIVVADFNGDGRDDIFIADHGYDTSPFPGAQNTLLLSSGAHGMINASSRLPQQSDYSHSATAGDVNGDGKIDLLVMNLYGGTPPTGATTAPYFLINDGTAHFTRVDNHLPSSIVNRVDTFTTCDLFDANGDGHLDLFLGSFSGSAPRVLINPGTGDFSNAQSITLPVGLFGPTTTTIDSNDIDLNGDGAKDLVLCEVPNNGYSSGGIQILMNDGSGHFTDETATRMPALTYKPGNWTNYAHMVDINGDGYVDLLASNGLATPIFLNDGTGHFINLPSSALDYGGWGTPEGITTVAMDANGDGRMDIVAQYQQATTSMNFWLFTSQDPGPTLTGTSGADALLGDSSVETLSGLGGNDVIFGAGGNDTLHGGDGNDYLNGGTGNDTVTGDAGNDTLYGFSGNDSLSGGEGNDVLQGGAGNDVLDGGNGIDTAVYSDATSGVTVNLGTTTAQAVGGGLGSDTLTSIENLAGSAFGDTLTGSSGNNTLTGAAGSDTINPGLGNDTVNAGAGNDTINLVGSLTAADKIDGGAGTDTVALNGNYAAGVTFSATTMVNVEKLTLAAGNSYTLTTNNAAVASGQTLTINSAALGASNVLTFNGAAETNGHFVIIGGLGADKLTGGALSDTFTYTSAAQSTGTHYDTITGFKFGTDLFDTPGAVGTITGINTKVTSGALSTATFDANLTSAISSSHLGAHHAILFTPTSGTLAGQTFLIVDLNGVAGYQSGHDLVIRMNGATGTLAAGGFH